MPLAEASPPHLVERRGQGRLAAALRADLQRYVEWQVARHRIPGDLPARFRGHAYSLYGPSRRRVDHGIVLVGDAAGVAAADSGEGIRPALESGLLAASAILAAAGRAGREDLGAYERALEERLGPSSPLEAPGPLIAWAAGRLLRWGFFARRVVLDHQFLGQDRGPLSVESLEVPAPSTGRAA